MVGGDDCCWWVVGNGWWVVGDIQVYQNTECFHVVVFLMLLRC